MVRMGWFGLITGLEKGAGSLVTGLYCPAKGVLGPGLPWLEVNRVTQVTIPGPSQSTHGLLGAEGCGCHHGSVPRSGASVPNPPCFLSELHTGSATHSVTTPFWDNSGCLWIHQAPFTFPKPPPSAPHYLDPHWGWRRCSCTLKQLPCTRPHRGQEMAPSARFNHQFISCREALSALVWPQSLPLELALLQDGCGQLYQRSQRPRAAAERGRHHHHNRVFCPERGRGHMGERTVVVPAGVGSGVREPAGTSLGIASSPWRPGACGVLLPAPGGICRRP